MKTTIFLLATVLTLIPETAYAALVPSDHPLFQENQVQEVRLYFEDGDFWDTLADNYENEIYLDVFMDDQVYYRHEFMHSGSNRNKV